MSGMRNVVFSIDGDTLIIRVDLSKNFGPSSTGKTIIVASTGGNVKVGRDEIKLGVNVYAPANQPGE